MQNIRSQQRVLHRREKGEDSYKNIPVYATRGLHESVMDVVESFRSHFGVSPLVLDLGAGRGAFSQRLLDHGFRVEAIEVDGNPWNAPDVPVRFVDFCATKLPNTIEGQYDIIVSIEVIEHIPDPVAFMRNIFAALKPGGIAIITTPNPLVVSAIALLIWKRQVPLFNYDLYWTLGHRNILPDFLLRAFAEHSGFEVSKMDYVCKGNWPLKLWLSFIPLFPAIIWYFFRYRNQWDKLHNLLVVTRPLAK